MIILFRKYFFQHASLIVLMFGALSFFASNIFMKEILSPELYGYLSVFITYFSFIYVFGNFGTEQVFLRFSVPEIKNKISTQKTVLYLSLFFTLFSALTGTILFNHWYKEITINPVFLFFSSLSIIGSTFLFSILRLNSNFVLSQLLSNSWKIGMFFLSAVYLIYSYSDFYLFLNIISMIMIVCFIFYLFYIIKKIQFNFSTERTNKQLFESSFHFFISISSFSLIIFADRFIVEHKYTFEKFGDFFYLSTFFLAPFSIIQSYIGFKQLIHFKTNFIKSDFQRFLKKVILFGVVIAVGLCAITFLIRYFKIINFPFEHYISIIILLLITGIVRLYASSVSAAFEAKTSIETLRKSNLLIVIITVLILLFTFIFVDSIEMITVNIIIVWFLRSLICKQLLYNQIKKEK